MTEPPPEDAPRTRLTAFRKWSAGQTTRGTALASAAWRRLKVSPWRRIGIFAAGAFGILFVAPLLFVTFADWNAFRGPVGRFASAVTGRDIVIDGRLAVKPWSWTPEIHATNVRIGNLQRFRMRGNFAEIGDATIAVHLPPLLIGRFDIVRLDLSGVKLVLYRAANGDANWTNAPGPAPNKPFNLPAIRQFSLRGGHLEYRDEVRRLSLEAQFATQESADRNHPGRFALDGDGRLNQQPFAINFSGAPLINVRRDQPYDFRADVRAGATHINANGAIAHPFDFSQWSADVEGSGDDLADLYTLIGLALPNTPPYTLRGHLQRNGDVYGMPRLSGRVGDSDLAGAFTARHRNGRLFLDGDFHTRNLDFDDLLTVLGAPPSTSSHESASPAQQQLAAIMQAEDRILPDARLDIGRVRNMDARVSYRADHVRSERVPLRGAAVSIRLDHGLMRLDPMTLDLSQGRVAGAVAINAREDAPRVDVDVRLTGARMESIFALRGDPPLTGSLLGRAHLTGRGASVRQAAANANGDITLVTPSGEVREAFAELTGINITRGLGLLLAHDQSKVAVRCGIASFHVTDGIARARSITFDTETMLIRGSGDVSLRDETFDLRIRGEPKQPRLVRLAAPIEIQGHLRDPHIGIAPGRSAGQTGIAAALASIVAPIAVLLPFVDPGLAHDADCSSLLAARTSPAHDG